MYCPSKTSLAQSWILSPGISWSAKKVGKDDRERGKCPELASQGPKGWSHLVQGWHLLWTAIHSKKYSWNRELCVPSLRHNHSRCDQQALWWSLHLPSGRHSKGTKNREKAKLGEKVTVSQAPRSPLSSVLGQSQSRSKSPSCRGRGEWHNGLCSWSFFWPQLMFSDSGHVSGPYGSSTWEINRELPWKPKILMICIHAPNLTIVDVFLRNALSHGVNSITSSNNHYIPSAVCCIRTIAVGMPTWASSHLPDPRPYLYMARFLDGHVIASPTFGQVTVIIMMPWTLFTFIHSI